MRALWSPAGKGLTSWLSFVVSNCEFVNFPLVTVRGQVWYLIVSIPNLCTLTYFVPYSQVVIPIHGVGTVPAKLYIFVTFPSFGF